MNWNPFRKKEDEPDPIDPTNITLADLKVGYVLDYDLKTWQVTAQHRYDFEGDRVDEWELTSGNDVVYLACEEDDGYIWALEHKIQLGSIEGNVRDHMRNNDDPPETITHNGITYRADSSSIGRFFKQGEGPGQEFITWDYLDDTEKRTLSIEQWGDDEYDASIGEIVEDYQFSNILPGG